MNWGFGQFWVAMWLLRNESGSFPRIPSALNHPTASPAPHHTPQGVWVYQQKVGVYKTVIFSVSITVSIEHWILGQIYKNLHSGKPTPLWSKKEKPMTALLGSESETQLSDPALDLLIPRLPWGGLTGVQGHPSPFARSSLRSRAGEGNMGDTMTRAPASSCRKLQQICNQRWINPVHSH